MGDVVGEVLGLGREPCWQGPCPGRCAAERWSGDGPRLLQVPGLASHPPRADTTSPLLVSGTQKGHAEGLPGEQLVGFSVGVFTSSVVSFVKNEEFCSH